MSTTPWRFTVPAGFRKIAMYEADIAAALAIHAPYTDDGLEGAFCCRDGESFPCDTVRALLGEGE